MKHRLEQLAVAVALSLTGLTVGVWRAMRHDCCPHD